MLGVMEKAHKEATQVTNELINLKPFVTHHKAGLR